MNIEEQKYIASSIEELLQGRMFLIILPEVDVTTGRCIGNTILSNLETASAFKVLNSAMQGFSPNVKTIPLDETEENNSH